MMPELFDTARQNPDRRDFLYLSTAAVGAVTAGAGIWPLIDSLHPSAEIRSVAQIEVDLAPVKTGQRVTAKWRGQPIFIDKRTETEIAAARQDDTAQLIDFQRDEDRVQDVQWLIVIGICTHLGCVPLGQGETERRGGWNGWFCPCHGSQYDTSGRVRKGPAPRNLVVPPYALTSQKTVLIG